MIYYSHINEDNSVERQILNEQVFEDLFCIAGSGERVISLLDYPMLRRIHIIDNNTDALYLTQLKLAVLKACSISDYSDFIGLTENKIDRILIFENIKEELSFDCKNYWQKRLKYIKIGVLNVGHFEKFLSNVRPLIKIFLGKNFYQCFNESFYSCESFPHRRWNFLKWLFSNRWVYLIAGNKDSAFISKGADQFIIPEALNKTLIEDEVNKNPLFHLVFNGHINKMPKEFMPISLSIESLEKVKHALMDEKFEIHYYKQDFLVFIKSFDLSKCRNSFYSLSDLLSFVDQDYVKQLLEMVRMRSNNYSSLVLRAFIRNRITDSQLKKIELAYGKLKDLSPFEKTRMYQVFQININK